MDPMALDQRGNFYQSNDFFNDAFDEDAKLAAEIKKPEKVAPEFGEDLLKEFEESKRVDGKSCEKVI